MSGLVTMTSTCTPSAARARPMYPHCSIPSLSSARFSSLFALAQFALPRAGVTQKINKHCEKLFLLIPFLSRFASAECRAPPRCTGAGISSGDSPFRQRDQKFLRAECSPAAWRPFTASRRRLPRPQVSSIFLQESRLHVVRKYAARISCITRSRSSRSFSGNSTSTRSCKLRDIQSALPM